MSKYLIQKIYSVVAKLHISIKIYDGKHFSGKFLFGKMLFFFFSFKRIAYVCYYERMYQFGDIIFGSDHAGEKFLFYFFLEKRRIFETLQVLYSILMMLQLYCHFEYSGEKLIGILVKLISECWNSTCILNLPYTHTHTHGSRF